MMPAEGADHALIGWFSCWFLGFWLIQGALLMITITLACSSHQVFDENCFRFQRGTSAPFFRDLPASYIKIRNLAIPFFGDGDGFIAAYFHNPA